MSKSADTFMIKNGGVLFNPCTNMTEAEARKAFDMYTGPQGCNGATFTLFRNGVEIDQRTVNKTKGAGPKAADKSAAKPS